MLQAERVIIFAAVHFPLTSERPNRHLALAGLGGASAAAAEELAIVSSVGTAAAVAILTAVVGEVFETYVAASARTGEYRRAGRSPDPDIVLTDLAEPAGYGHLGRSARQPDHGPRRGGVAQRVRSSRAPPPASPAG